MHIHFHTLKRQRGAQTLAAISPICIPSSRTHTHTPCKTPNTAKMNVCVPFNECGWKSTPCHIYLHKSRRCMCVCLDTCCLCGSMCLFRCICVHISSFASPEEKNTNPSYSVKVIKSSHSLDEFKRERTTTYSAFSSFLDVTEINILQHALQVQNKQFSQLNISRVRNWHHLHTKSTIPQLLPFFISILKCICWCRDSSN